MKKNTNYTKIAREAVEEFIKNKTIKNCGDFKNTKEKAGVFVSIYKKSNKKLAISDKKYELRGCIGTYLPTRKNIIEEIVYNAISAATHDLRFLPITPQELPNLCYSVDVLEKPKPVKALKELDPKKYGIIVKAQDGSSGLLLPDLEGVNNINQQILFTCDKAGINPHKEKISIFRFKVKRYKE